MSVDNETVVKALIMLGYSREQSKSLLPKKFQSQRSFDSKVWEMPRKKTEFDHLSSFNSKLLSSKLGNSVRPSWGSSKYKSTGLGGCIAMRPSTNSEVTGGPFSRLGQRRRETTLPQSKKCSSMELGQFYRESWKKNAVERLYKL